MKIYTYWNPSAPVGEDQAQMIRLWQRSWTLHGWEPRLLTSLNVKRSKDSKFPARFFDQMCLALCSVGGGWLTLPSVINIGLKPYRPKEPVLLDPWVMAYINKRQIAAFARGELLAQSYFPDAVLNKCRVFGSAAAALASGLCR